MTTFEAIPPAPVPVPPVPANPGVSPAPASAPYAGPTVRPDVIPVDPSRPPIAKATSTHIVRANGLGPEWVRGDRIEAADLPDGVGRLNELVALGAVRPMEADELKANPAPADNPKGKGK